MVLLFFFLLMESFRRTGIGTMTRIRSVRIDQTTLYMLNTKKLTHPGPLSSSQN